MAVKIFKKSLTAKRKVDRIKRAKRARMHIRKLQTQDPALTRLVVDRSSNHISAQLVKYSALDRQTQVLATVTTKAKAVKELCKGTGNIEAAKLVGKLIAEKAQSLKIDKLAFDRSGYLYHGRVAALADAARENGLEF